MEEPKFKADDKAEFQTGDKPWTPVYIVFHGLLWAGRYGGGDNIYLVQCVGVEGRTGPPFLVNERHLRPVEQWEPCPGRHRLAPEDFRHHPDGASGPWERRVRSEG